MPKTRATTAESNSPTVPASIDLAVLLDTSIAILVRDDAVAAKVILAQLETRPVLSVITKVELEGGVYTRPDMLVQRRRRLDALLRRFDVVNFDADMAAIYGQIVAQQGFSRRKIIDRMIAATALAIDAVLITANVGDFAEIEDLKLEAWPVA